MIYRLASIGLGLALATSACAPTPDTTAGASSSDTGDSDSSATDAVTGTGAAAQPFSAELINASLDAISGCSVYTDVYLRIRVTAPDDQAIAAVTLTSVDFMGQWSDTELEVVTPDLPVAAGATAQLSFSMSVEGDVAGLSDCFDKEFPTPSVVATFEIDGQSVELAGLGALGCGFDEPGEDGC